MDFQFDGANKRIYVQSGTLSFVATDLYSEWKRWIIQSDNIKYIQAMRSIGGDALSQTKFIAPYIELMNEWKIKPYDGDYTLSVQGNLFATGGETPFIGADNGTVLISMETTGNALALSSNTETQTDIIAPVWNSSVGITDVYQSGNLLNIRWGYATDDSNDVRYNVYISDIENSLFNFKLGSFKGNMINIATEFDGITPLSTNTYYVGVRAVDKFNNETDNTNYGIVNFQSTTISDTNVNIVSVNGVEINSVDDFKSDGLNEIELHNALDSYSNKDLWKADTVLVDNDDIALAVWNYSTRELTVAAGLTSLQEDKINDIISNTTDIDVKVWNSSEKDITSNIKYVNDIAVHNIDEFKANETVVNLNPVLSSISDVQTKVDTLENYDDTNLTNLINNINTLLPDERLKLMSLLNYDDTTINSKLDNIDSVVDSINTNITNLSNDINIVDNIVRNIPQLSEIRDELINVTFGGLEITSDNKMIIKDQSGSIITIFSLFDNNGNPTTNMVYKRTVD